MFHPVHSPRYQHSGFISITRGFAIFPHDKKVYQYAAHHFTLARGFAYSPHFIHADYDTPIFGVTWFIHNTTLEAHRTYAHLWLCTVRPLSRILDLD